MIDEYDDDRTGGVRLTAPDRFMINTALAAAALSPCRSKRGVALFKMRTGAFRGSGFNGPPALLPCPGRDRCAGNCGQRSVHAESRALRDAAVWGRGHDLSELDLVHVELAANNGVEPCAGPSCWQCAREILDVGFVQGVWLYERCDEHPASAAIYDHGHWRRYTAEQFYSCTLHACGIQP